MNPIAIVLDTTTVMPAHLVEEYGFTVVPNTMSWEGKEYRDGVDITIDDFLERLETAKSFPKTAAVSPQAFKEAFESLIAKGKDVLAILPTHNMTRVPLSAVQAAEEIKQGNVEIVETEVFGMATGWAAILAARAAREGATLAACKALAAKAGSNAGTVGFANRLDLLRASGRVNRVQEAIGTQLKVKPILATVDGGKIDVIERARTRRRAIDRVIEIVVERVAGRTPLYIGVQYVEVEADAQQALDILQSRLDIKESMVSSLGANTAAHFGPGTVGVSYVINEPV